MIIAVAGGVAWWLKPWAPDVEPASIEKMAFPLPDKPSVAVLPFTNMSGDKDQDYFADGMTEDIITDLSKISGLFVIGRTSTRRYKGKATDVRQIARDLGVRYVVEGSVRKAADRVRVTTQLIDATTGKHLWAERYDRPLADVFAIQYEIAGKVVSELEVTLTADDRARTVRKYTPKPEAHDAYLLGRAIVIPPTRKNLAAGQALFEKAIALDPKYAGGYAGLSFTHFLKYSTRRGASPRDDIRAAILLAEKAVELDPTSHHGYRSLMFARLFNQQLAEAHAAIKKALELAPSDAITRGAYAFILQFLGDPEEGLMHAKQARRASPYDIAASYFLGANYRAAGQYAKAIQVFELRREQLGRIDPNPELHLAAAYMEAGREADARATIEGILKVAPHYTMEAVRHQALYKRPEDVKRFLDAIRKAGMPE